jgi:hypothetical protein
MTYDEPEGGTKRMIVFISNTERGLVYLLGDDGQLQRAANSTFSPRSQTEKIEVVAPSERGLPESISEARCYRQVVSHAIL